MPKNINSITIIIILEGIEKIRDEKQRQQQQNSLKKVEIIERVWVLFNRRPPYQYLCLDFWANPKAKGFLVEKRLFSSKYMYFFSFQARRRFSG